MRIMKWFSKKNEEKQKNEVASITGETKNVKKSGNFTRQVERNQKGIAFEREGNIEEAIKLYETNVSENFEGNHPYDSLIHIYKKQGKPSEVIRVLEKAVYVFENCVHHQRADRDKKLLKFKERLEREKMKNVNQ